MHWQGVYPRHTDPVLSVGGVTHKGQYSGDFCSSYHPLPNTFWTQVCLLAPLDDILTPHILNKTSFFSSHSPLLLSVPVTWKHTAIQSDAQSKIQKTTLATLLSSVPTTRPSSFFHFPPYMHLKPVTFCPHLRTPLSRPPSGLMQMTLTPSWHPTRFVLHSAS